MQTHELVVHINEQGLIQLPAELKHLFGKDDHVTILYDEMQTDRADQQNGSTSITNGG